MCSGLEPFLGAASASSKSPVMYDALLSVDASAVISQRSEDSNRDRYICPSLAQSDENDL